MVHQPKAFSRRQQAAIVASAARFGDSGGSGMPRVSAAARKTSQSFGLPVGVLLCTLSGCIGLDASERAELTPIGSTAFVYHASTDLFYGPSAFGWAEARRLAWLPGFLRSYGLCPLGFTLTSRQVSFLYEDPLGEAVDDIRYEGHCIYPPTVPQLSRQSGTTARDRYGARQAGAAGAVA